MPSTVRREVEAEDEYLRGLPTPTSSVPSPVEPLRRSVRRSSLTRVRPSFIDTSAELPEAPEDGTLMFEMMIEDVAQYAPPAYNLVVRRAPRCRMCIPHGLTAACVCPHSYHIPPITGTSCS